VNTNKRGYSEESSGSEKKHLLKKTGIWAAFALGALGVLAWGSDVRSSTAIDGAPVGILTAEQKASARSGLISQLERVSPEQRRAAADGKISKSEVDRLATAADNCARGKGAPKIQRTWTQYGYERGLVFSKDVSFDEMDRIQALADQCWMEHVGVVEQMMALEVVPTEDEQRAFNLRVTECLKDAGVDLQEWPSTQVDIDPSLEANCVDQANS